jgi:hypothetical protein
VARDPEAARLDGEQELSRERAGFRAGALMPSVVLGPVGVVNRYEVVRDETILTPAR